ncbi:hypothetical protein [Streptococcus sanguinis]|uniref:hypothetical protein n=1 Tax=Streptococcus sanguinis TaxID=1305 RepID=UPI003857EBF8
MTKEQDFWNRILELAHAQLKQTTYDFFVAEAKLVKVEEKQAVIFLDRMNQKIIEKEGSYDQRTGLLESYFRIGSCSAKTDNL